MSRLTTLCLAALLLAGCNTLDRTLDSIARPTVRLAGVGLEDADLESATLRLDLEVKNPYSVPLPLVNLDYALASQGAQFLDGVADLQGVIPARAQETVAVPARLSYRGLLDALQGVRPGAIMPSQADLGLSVDAPALGDLRLPLQHRGELPVPAAPEARVAGVEWSERSLSRVAGLVRLELVNRNQFPVDLARLDYGLSLGGVEVARSSLAEAVAFEAGGAGAVSIPVEFSPAELGRGLLSMLTSDGDAWDVGGGLEVDTRFGKLRLPLSSAGR